jgi:hypothetical protein
LDREVQRKKVKIPLNGQSEGDNHPAAVTNYEEDDEEKADTQKAEQRGRVAIDGLAGHPRGGNEEPEGDQGEANLLSGEILHAVNLRWGKNM